MNALTTLVATTGAVVALAAGTALILRPSFRRLLVELCGSEPRRGRFLLDELPGGRTRLEGTTWYTNRMWPEQYWRVFSNEIIHRIHLRVLEHIRERAEGSKG